MTLEEAQISTIKHNANAKTIHATSDGSIYLNGDIKALEKHAKDNNLELFHIKPEKPEKKK